MANHIAVSGVAEEYNTRGPPFFRLSDHDAEASQHISKVFAALTEQHAINIDWKKYDVLMVDNTRFMHGRRKFTGRRNVQLRMYSAPKEERKLWRHFP